MRRYFVDKQQLKLGFGQLISWYIRETITGEELVFLLKNRLKSIITGCNKKEFSYR